MHFFFLAKAPLWCQQVILQWNSFYSTSKYRRYTICKFLGCRMFGPLKIFHFFKLVSFVLFFLVTENRELLGELNGIDTLLQCLSVSSLSKIFFSSLVYKDNSSKLVFRKLLFKLWTRISFPRAVTNFSSSLGTGKSCWVKNGKTVMVCLP